VYAFGVPGCLSTSNYSDPATARRARVVWRNSVTHAHTRSTRQSSFQPEASSTLRENLTSLKRRMRAMSDSQQWSSSHFCETGCGLVRGMSTLADLSKVNFAFYQSVFTFLVDYHFAYSFLCCCVTLFPTVRAFQNTSQTLLDLNSRRLDTKLLPTPLNILDILTNSYRYAWSICCSRTTCGRTSH
jgi:hypothetical protein